MILWVGLYFVVGYAVMAWMEYREARYAEFPVTLWAAWPLWPWVVVARLFLWVADRNPPSPFGWAEKLGRRDR